MDVMILLDLIGVSSPVIRNFYMDTGWLFDAFVSAEDNLGKLGILWEHSSVEGDRWDTQGLTGGRTRRIFEKRNNKAQVYAGRIEDDHLPFLERGVPILHLIPVP